MCATKRRVDAPSSDDGPKRLRAMEPDVTIVVGGETFHHYSQIVCNASEYFDTMLSSNMKESITKVVELNEKKTNDWKEISVFIDNPAAADLNEENVEKLVPWFSELQMTSWLARSDDFYKAKILKSKDQLANASTKNRARENHATSRASYLYGVIRIAVDSLKVSITYGLPLSKQEGLFFLQKVLEECPHFLNSRNCVASVASFFHDEEAKIRLWPSLKKGLPESCQNIKTDSLADNELLEAVVQLRATPN